MGFCCLRQEACPGTDLRKQPESEAKKKPRLSKSARLTEAAKTDTVCRDVYVRRAREHLRPTLDEPPWMGTKGDFLYRRLEKTLQRPNNWRIYEAVSYCGANKQTKRDCILR